MASYRDNTNTNNISRTTHDEKIVKRSVIFFIYIFTPRFLKTSIDLQTAFAAESCLAEVQLPGVKTERGKVVYNPSRNTNDSFDLAPLKTFISAVLANSFVPINYHFPS